MNRQLLLLSVPTLLLLSLAGCTAGGQGTAGVMVSDAPVDDFSSVIVTVTKVQIHKSGEGNESGWQTLSETVQSVDFIALHHADAAKSLGFSEVDAGRYQQVRLGVSKIEGTYKSDGSKVVMKLPSGEIKTSKSFEVKEGGNTTIHLEFDLNKSINCRSTTDCTFSPQFGKVEATEKT